MGCASVHLARAGLTTGVPTHGGQQLLLRPPTMTGLHTQRHPSGCHQRALLERQTCAWLPYQSAVPHVKGSFPHASDIVLCLCVLRTCHAAAGAAARKGGGRRPSRPQRLVPPARAQDHARAEDRATAAAAEGRLRPQALLQGTLRAAQRRSGRVRQRSAPLGLCTHSCSLHENCSRVSGTGLAVALRASCGPSFATLTPRLAPPVRRPRPIRRALTRPSSLRTSRSAP